MARTPLGDNTAWRTSNCGHDRVTASQLRTFLKRYAMSAQRQDRASEKEGGLRVIYNTHTQVMAERGSLISVEDFLHTHKRASEGPSRADKPPIISRHADELQ